MSLPDEQSRINKPAKLIEDAKAELSAVVGVQGTDVSMSGAISSQLPKHVHYKIFRDYIEHEDGLVNNRLLWNINIQGFLFATYGFSVQKLAEIQHGVEGTGGSGATALRWLLVILPFFGGSISFLSWQGVMAAQKATINVKTLWMNTAEKEHPAGHPTLPGITGGGEGPNTIAGHKAPKIFPWLFIGAWVLLFLAYVWPSYIWPFLSHFWSSGKP
jgi:hypothetical protein